MADGQRRRVGRPPSSDAEPTADRILSASLRLFADQGYAATSVRQIARAVGVTDAALYAHFPSKQSIFDRLIESMGPPSAALMGMDVTAAGAGPRAAIPDAVWRLMDYWTQPDIRMFSAVLLRERSAAHDLAAAIETARAALTPVFARWQKAGALRADVPARQIVWELLAPLNNIRFLYLGHDATDTQLAAAKQMAAEHLDYFMTCVCVDPTEWREP